VKHLVRTSLAVLLTVLGCGGCLDQPFGITLVEHDEEHTQQQALITLGDPQIFSRETLVDDRRAEVEFLQDLLAKSKDAQFEPELRRQTRVVTALAAELGIKFDPAAGASAGQAAELGQLRHQIELTRLRAELEAAQKAAESGTAPGAGTGTTASGSAPTVSGLGLDEVRKVTAELGKVADRLEKAADDKIEETRAAATGSSPRDRFRDLQAYRGELRAALESVILDDVHDDDGNSLYRLEFRATVLPGEHKGQLGVARLTVHPPRLTERDIEYLYRLWLSHLSLRLNRRLRAPYEPPAFGSVQAFDQSGVFFRLLFFPFAFDGRDAVACRDFDGLKKSDRCGGVWLALPLERFAEYVKLLTPIIPPKGSGAKPPERVWPALERVSKERLKRLSVHELIEGCERFRDAVVAINPRMILIASIQSVLDRSWRSTGSNVREQILQRLAETRAYDLDPLSGLSYFDILDQLDICVAAAYERLGGTGLSDAQRQSLEKWDPRVYDAPWTFTDLLVTLKEDSPGDFVPDRGRGDVVVYAAHPIELAQRVSSVASAADAIQLAGALSAVVPGQGVGADLGIGSLQYAVGQAEAIERAPVIVGFSDREEVPPTPEHASATRARFGWVFGPRAYFTYEGNDATLRLQQSVVNQQVTADISAPGWWPSLELHLETAWVRNWRDVQPGHGVDVLDAHDEARVRKQVFEVGLPLNRADLDGLTALLFKSISSPAMRETQIDEVYPDQLSACGGEATLLVYGRDVWRSSSAYLGSMPAQSVRVLPDMGGIAVTIDTKKLPLPLHSDVQKLTISTRNGTDTFDVTVKGASTTKKCEG
jgi:hypothetical protein